MGKVFNSQYRVSVHSNYKNPIAHFDPRDDIAEGEKIQVEKIIYKVLHKIHNADTAETELIVIELGKAGN